jgi:hypothetical protein
VKELERKYIILGGLFLFVGMFFFLLQRNWLIIRWVGFWGKEKISTEVKKNISTKKIIRLFYWKDDRFQNEEVSVVWFKNVSENIKHTINNWLAFLYEERILARTVLLESVAVADGGAVAILSFDQSFLSREWSIQKKWRTIESLLKTLSQAKFSIQSIMFLVKYHKMEDDHIDFSRTWPMGGELGE